MIALIRLDLIAKSEGQRLSNNVSSFYGILLQKYKNFAGYQKEDLTWEDQVDY